MNNHDVKYLFYHQDQETMIIQKVVQSNNAVIHPLLTVANQDAKHKQEKNFTRTFKTLLTSTQAYKNRLFFSSSIHKNQSIFIVKYGIYYAKRRSKLQNCVSLLYIHQIRCRHQAMRHIQYFEVDAEQLY